MLPCLFQQEAWLASPLWVLAYSPEEQHPAVTVKETRFFRFFSKLALASVFKLFQVHSSLSNTFLLSHDGFHRSPEDDEATNKNRATILLFCVVLQLPPNLNWWSFFKLFEEQEEWLPQVERKRIPMRILDVEISRISVADEARYLATARTAGKTTVKVHCLLFYSVIVFSRTRLLRPVCNRNMEAGDLVHGLPEGVVVLSRLLKTYSTDQQRSTIRYRR